MIPHAKRTGQRRKGQDLTCANRRDEKVIYAGRTAIKVYLSTLMNLVLQVLDRYRPLGRDGTDLRFGHPIPELDHLSPNTCKALPRLGKPSEKYLVLGKRRLSKAYG